MIGGSATGKQRMQHYTITLILPDQFQIRMGEISPPIPGIVGILKVAGKVLIG
jgi:hypothetical protein